MRGASTFASSITYQGLLGISWNLTTEFFQMMQQAKIQHQNPFFMETFIITAWQIWKQRNNYISDRGRPSFGSWKISFYE
jgi:hypothetical protein